MLISRSEKKIEAIKRMELLKLLPSIIEEFEKKETLYYSESVGILYWVSNKPEWVEYIKNFERKHNVLVYHAEFSRLEFGDCLSLFYVSVHKDEWKYDIADLKAGYSCCYVWNIDDDICSEFGSIGIKSMNGGVKRLS